MFISQKTIVAPCDFNSRFVANLVQSIVAMKSAPYIATIDRNINAKSILGLLSVNIKQGDDVCIQVVDNHSQEQTEEDLDFMLKMILGDD